MVYVTQGRVDECRGPYFADVQYSLTEPRLDQCGGKDLSYV